MRVALLGLGKMGTAVGRHLLKHGHSLDVWNRTPAATEPLAKEGARVMDSARNAVSGMPVVFTMLTDDEAVRSVVLGPEGISRFMDEDAIHVCLSTISVSLSRQLAEEHRQRRRHFVAAPVFGRPHVAEQGKLWIAVGGTPTAVERIQPLLQAISRGITVVSGEPWRAHALKLGGNFMISAMIAALSEAFIFADAQGIDPELFLETVNSALFQSPLYALYAKTMLNPPEVPGGTVALAIKDVGLFREAAGPLQLPLADHVSQELRRAQEAGMKDQDLAVGQFRMAKTTATQTSGKTG